MRDTSFRRVGIYAAQEYVKEVCGFIDSHANPRLTAKAVSLFTASLYCTTVPPSSYSCWAILCSHFTKDRHTELLTRNCCHTAEPQVDYTTTLRHFDISDILFDEVEHEETYRLLDYIWRRKRHYALLNQLAKEIFDSKEIDITGLGTHMNRLVHNCICFGVFVVREQLGECRTSRARCLKTLRAISSYLEVPEKVFHEALLRLPCFVNTTLDVTVLAAAALVMVDKFYTDDVMFLFGGQVRLPDLETMKSLLRSGSSQLSKPRGFESRVGREERQRKCYTDVTQPTLAAISMYQYDMRISQEEISLNTLLDKTKKSLKYDERGKNAKYFTPSMWRSRLPLNFPSILVNPEIGIHNDPTDNGSYCDEDDMIAPGRTFSWSSILSFDAEESDENRMTRLRVDRSRQSDTDMAASPMGIQTKLATSANHGIEEKKALIAEIFDQRPVSRKKSARKKKKRRELPRKKDSIIPKLKDLGLIRSRVPGQLWRRKFTQMDVIPESDLLRHFTPRPAPVLLARHAPSYATEGIPKARRLSNESLDDDDEEEETPRRSSSSRKSLPKQRK